VYEMLEQCARFRFPLTHSAGERSSEPFCRRRHAVISAVARGMISATCAPPSRRRPETAAFVAANVSTVRKC